MAVIKFRNPNSVFSPDSEYEDYDEQMVELFEWGENEQNKWQVHT